MKSKFKIGEKVIITNGTRNALIGKVATVSQVGDWTGKIILKEYGDEWFHTSFLVKIKGSPETENLLLEREYEKEAYGLKVFVVGIFAFIFFVLGMFFLLEDSKSMPLVNYMTGLVSIVGAMFMVWIIKEEQKDKRALNRGFNQEIVEARTEDLL